MENPFTRPQAGAYVALLIAGFEALSMKAESELFARGKVKLAIASSITGNVKVQPQLTAPCIEALKKVTNSESARYYEIELLAGRVIPASSDGAFVYDPNDKDAVAHVEREVARSNQEVIHPFFKS